MLTSEILKANESLQGLSDDQVKAVVELSKNDENAVIAAKVREIHDQYDADIKEATGMEKPASLKTYQWLKNTVLPVVKEAQDYKAQLTENQKTIEALKADIKNGKGGEQFKSRIAELEQKETDYQNQVSELQQQLEKTGEEWQSKLNEQKGQFDLLRVNSTFDSGLTGLKFKGEYDETVRNVFIENAKTKLLSQFKPDWIDDGNNGQRLVFRDQNGVIQNNKENGLNPFTASELLKKELLPILDQGREQPGAGSKPGGSGNGTTVSIQGAKTQSEAAEAIATQLMGLGIARGTNEFQTKLDEAWKEYNIQELPIR